MLRKCNLCGLEANNEEQLLNFIINKGAKYGRKNLCRICDSKRQKVNNKEVKLEGIRYKGGKCLHCSIEATIDNTIIFDFHHVDRSTKEFTIAKFRTNFSKLKDELDKCILLCSNCHRLEHAND